MIVPIEKFANLPDNSINDIDNLLSSDLINLEDITTSASYGGVSPSSKKKGRGTSKKQQKKQSSTKKTNWRK